MIIKPITLNVNPTDFILGSTHNTFLSEHRNTNSIIIPDSKNARFKAARIVYDDISKIIDNVFPELSEASLAYYEEGYGISFENVWVDRPIKCFNLLLYLPKYKNTIGWIIHLIKKLEATTGIYLDYGELNLNAYDMELPVQPRDHVEEILYDFGQRLHHYTETSDFFTWLSPADDIPCTLTYMGFSFDETYIQKEFDPEGTGELFFPIRDFTDFNELSALKELVKNINNFAILLNEIETFCEITMLKDDIDNPNQTELCLK